MSNSTVGATALTRAVSHLRNAREGFNDAIDCIEHIAQKGELALRALARGDAAAATDALRRIAATAANATLDLTDANASSSAGRSEIAKAIAQLKKTTELEAA